MNRWRVRGGLVENFGGLSMGGIGSKSRTLRGAIASSVHHPAPRRHQLAFCSANGLPSTTVTSNPDHAATEQKSEELHRSAAPARSLVSGSESGKGAEFDRVRVLGRGSRRAFSSTVERRVEARCWSCEAPSAAAPFFVCASCAAIQPLDLDLDFFQLLSVERSYVQDAKELERKYKQLQKFLHPDLASRKAEREQVYAADQSAQVIKAYYTLLNPLSRAQYMLRLSGVNVDEEGTIHDPALLMEIMELREEVEEATDAEKLVKIKEQSKRKMLECENTLKEMFQSGDIMHAVPLVQRMTYYHKIVEEITRKQ